MEFWINFLQDNLFSDAVLIFNKHCRGDFCEYIQAHKDPDVTNDTKERTYDALYLGPTGNLQGTFKAFDLKTGRVKKNRNFTRVPMPDLVAKLVNNWGKRSQKEHQKKKLELLNRLQNCFDWEN